MSTKLNLLAKNIKWLDIGSVIIYTVFIIWVFSVDSLCIDPQCNQINFDNRLIFSLIFVTWAFINAFRTGLSYYIKVDSEGEELDISQYLFYISLIGPTIVFILYGIFIEEFLLIAEKRAGNTLIFIISILALFATIVIYMFDKNISWDKCKKFIKIRVTFSLIHAIFLIASPSINISLFVSVLFMAAGALYYDDKTEEELEQL